jgi:hypothetical protein
MLSDGCKSSEEFPLTPLELAALILATLSHKGGGKKESRRVGALG